MEQLTPDDSPKLAAWNNRRQAEAWDREIEADAKAGKLDKLIDEALEDLRTERTAPALKCASSFARPKPVHRCGISSRTN